VLNADNATTAAWARTLAGRVYWFTRHGSVSRGAWVADGHIQLRHATDGEVEDAAGRAQVSGLKPGARVKASVVVDGTRLESQEVTIAQSGIRFVLAAPEPGAAGGAVGGTQPIRLVVGQRRAAQACDVPGRIVRVCLVPERDQTTLAVARGGRRGTGLGD
jgi:hypothetical protein